jgi:hypothetical protein
MPDREDALKNINYDNITKATTVPVNVEGINTENEIYDDIITSYEDNSISLQTLQTFTTISQARDRIYGLIDVMAEDPIISIALDIYTSDACATNQKGQSVWCESSDSKTLSSVNYILEKTGVNKNVRSWMYNLIKYGDVYLRLYRKSDIENQEEKEKPKAQLKENMVLKAYAPRDKYAKYVEMQKNPAEVFELYKFGKSVGYIRAHIGNRDLTDKILNYSVNDYTYDYQIGDVDVYSALDYVHGFIEDNSNRVEEKISITQNIDSEKLKYYTYKVRRGRSMLCNIFKIWRTLTLLENSVLLNRLTQSSIIRVVSAEIGDMEKQEANKLKWRLKQFIEQKAAVNPGNDFNEYLNTGSLINTIYTVTHDGVGAISVSNIGGDVNVGDLVDLDYFKNKLYGSLGIPKQYLGDTDDATGFNGGTSLALTSSRYGMNVKLYQNVMCQMISDMVNLMLLDQGSKDCIGKFKIKMVAPMTQEEKDRQENMSTLVAGARDFLGLFSEAGLEDNIFKLKVLKTLLPNITTESDIIMLLSDKIEELEKQSEEGQNSPNEMNDGFGENFNSGENFGGSLGDGSTFNDWDSQSVNNDLNTYNEQSAGNSEIWTPDQDINSSEGFQEETSQSLPTFDEMGVNYNEV